MNEKSDNSTRQFSIKLPPLLDEFRAALQDEIEVAKRNSSNNSIPLNNGHKIDQQGSSFQYVFLIDTVLNTPDGSPCDLIVPGKNPVSATIVSIEGLSIVISVGIELGQFVPTACLQTDLTMLMRKLIERIENNASASNPAASRMLGIARVDGIPNKLTNKPNLDDDQLLALESALGRNLTVIWGPPGTGKTRTIGTIAKHLYDLNRTVLIVSHTNTAVNQAIKHVAGSLSDHLKQGTVIRVGEVNDEELKTKYPDVLIKQQVENQSKDLVKRLEDLDQKKQNLADELSSVQEEISILGWLQAAEPGIQACSNNITQLHDLELQITPLEKSLKEMELEKPSLLKLHNLTSRILDIHQQLIKAKNKATRLIEQISNIESRIHEAKGYCQEQQKRLEIVERITPLREERTTYSTLEEQKSLVGTFSSKLLVLNKQMEDIQKQYSLASDILVRINNANNLTRILKRLPKLVACQLLN